MTHWPGAKVPIAIGPILLSFTTTPVSGTLPLLQTTKISEYDCGPEPTVISLGWQSFVRVMLGLV